MKILSFALFAALLGSAAFSQTNVSAPLTVHRPGEVNPYILLKSDATGAPYGLLQYDQSEGNYMRLFDGSQFSMVWRAGNVGIGTSDPKSPLHIYGMGNANLGTIRLDSPNIFTSITSRQADNAGEPEGFTVISGSSDTGNNIVSIGGGLDEFNAATILDFRTAPGNSTRTGAVRMRITNQGNVGIGTLTPNASFTVKGGVSIENANLQTGSVPAGDLALSYGQAIRFGNDSNNATIPVLAFGAFDGRANTLRVGTDAWPSQIVFRTGDLYSPQFPGDIRMVIANSGNVGIGTTNPTQKLAVNGTIKAKEVIVETSGWPDHVFADDYALQPLAEVETHIKTNKHLPGIPSAVQVAEEGISVGDMQAKLLAKIEELTLHQIAQEKELAHLRSEVGALRAAVR